MNSSRCLPFRFIYTKPTVQATILVRQPPLLLPPTHSSLTLTLKFGSCSFKYWKSQLPWYKFQNLEKRFFTTTVKSIKSKLLQHLPPQLNSKFKLKIYFKCLFQKKRSLINGDSKQKYDTKKFLREVSDNLNSDLRNIFQKTMKTSNAIARIWFWISIEIYFNSIWAGLLAVSQLIFELITHFKTRAQRRHFSQLFLKDGVTSLTKIDTITDSNIESIYEDKQMEIFINNIKIDLQKKGIVNFQLVLRVLVPTSVQRIKESFIRQPEMKFNQQNLSLVFKKSIQEEIQIYNMHLCSNNN